MKTSEKEKICLTAEETAYIRELIIENEYIIRAQIKEKLKGKFAYLGEECIGDLYLLACQKAHVLINHPNPVGWLIIAARNIVKNAERKYKTVVDKTIDKELTDIPSGDQVIEDALYNIWMQEGSIERLLALLSPREREIYEMLYKEKRTSIQTANILGISDSTVRNIALTIKKKIKDGIEKELF